MGFWQSVRDGPPRSACEKGHTPCVDRLLRLPPPCSTAALARGMRQRQRIGRLAADQGHRRDAQGGVRDAERRRRSRSAVGQKIELDVTADAPVRSTCTRPRSRSSPTRQGRPDFDLKPIPAPGRVTVESHTLNKTLVHPRGPVTGVSLLLPPRTRRRAGPADLPRARHRRSRRRRRRLVRRPGARLAHAAVRRRDQRAAGPGVAGGDRRLRAVAGPAAPGRAARPDLPGARRGAAARTC